MKDLFTWQENALTLLLWLEIWCGALLLSLAAVKLAKWWVQR